MPAVASLEDLQKVFDLLGEIKEKHPEAYEEVKEVFRKHRKIGYKNICKMMMGESTPESLKKDKN